MKRFCLICLMGLTLLMTGCATGPESSSGGEPYEEFITVGFSQVGAESDWRNANTKSMKEALSEENGFRLILDDAQQKQEPQITAHPQLHPAGGGLHRSGSDKGNRWVRCWPRRAPRALT